MARKPWPAQTAISTRELPPSAVRVQVLPRSTETSATLTADRINEAWLSVQEQMHGRKLEPAQKIFEADRSSGFGRNSKTVTLSASSIHRRTQRLLAIAGITGERASAQTLRNTYAGLLIDGGATDDHLVDYLGLQASVTAQRLRTAYAKSQPKPASDAHLSEEG